MCVREGMCVCVWSFFIQWVLFCYLFHSCVCLPLYSVILNIFDPNLFSIRPWRNVVYDSMTVYHKLKRTAFYMSQIFNSSNPTWIFSGHFQAMHLNNLKCGQYLSWSQNVYCRWLFWCFVKHWSTFSLDTVFNRQTRN